MPNGLALQLALKNTRSPITRHITQGLYVNAAVGPKGRGDVDESVVEVVVDGARIAAARTVASRRRATVSAMVLDLILGQGAE